MMGLQGISAGSVLVLVRLQEMAAARATAAGRGLYAGEESRPGRSDLAYMQHKYTPLDSRIIIITAAILLLLLSILFLNFFIRWALRRFFLSRSQKPINPNKGLSKRQVQALPFFIFSSSTPPPCAHPNIYPPLFPIFSPSHPLNPTSPKLDHIPTKLDVSLHDPAPPSQSVSTYIIKVDNDPPSNIGSLDVDQVVSSKDPPTIEKDEAVNNANTIIASSKANVHDIHDEVKWDSPTFNSGNPIIDCTKAHEIASHGDDNANSHASCPICLVDFADGDTIRVLPNCRHYFHIGCIDLWLAKNSSCPACRANLLEATRTHPTLHIQVVTTNSP